jgi:hypothetical protein
MSHAGGVHTRMRHALAPLAAIFAIQALPAAAQDRDPYSGAPLPPHRQVTPSPITDTFAVRVIYYVPQLRTTLRVDPSAPPGALGTPVDAENDLGLPDRLHSGRAEFMFRLRERGKVRMSYFESDRSGSAVLTHDIIFGNVTFTSGQLMQSSLDWRQFDITYTYSFVHNDRFEVGTGVGVYFLQVDAIGQEPTQNQRQEVSGASPFPALPLDVVWCISSRWALSGRGAYLRASLANFDGWYADLHGDVQYRFGPNFALGLGYTSLRTSLTRTGGSFPGLFHMSTSGPEAFLRFSF